MLTVSEGARAFLAAAVALVAGCAGAPWHMGAPLDGKPSIPEVSEWPGPKVLRERAAGERAVCRKATELRALLDLERAARLGTEERDRLVCLLGERASAFRSLRRGQPWARDLKTVERLAPGRVPRAARAEAETAAGDELLAAGDLDGARAAFDRAAAVGGQGLEVRHVAARAEPPPAAWSPADIASALASLPPRAAAPFAQEYLRRGGHDSIALQRCVRAAREAGRPELATLARARLTAGSSTAVPPPTGDRRVALPPRFLAVESCGAACDVPPGDLDRWPLAGASVAFRLIPLLRQNAKLMAPGDRSREWADLMLAEDPSAPEVLEIAAMIDGLGGRTGGAERRLGDLVYWSRDRRQGLETAARVWETLGRTRPGCAAWVRAARWSDDPEDPAWDKAVACARKDPGAGSWRQIRDYVVSRAPPERRNAVAARLDAAAGD